MNKSLNYRTNFKLIDISTKDHSALIFRELKAPYGESKIMDYTTKGHEIYFEPNLSSNRWRLFIKNGSIKLKNTNGLLTVKYQINFANMLLLFPVIAVIMEYFEGEPIGYFRILFISLTLILLFIVPSICWINILKNRDRNRIKNEFKFIE